MIVGRTYTREEISREHGGEQQSYLPQKNKRVVCGCFRLVTNPQAPGVVLAGRRPIIYQKAKLLCEQGGSIPVFIKLRPGAWRYEGDFTVSGWSEDPRELLSYEQASGRKGIARIIYLRPVER